MADTKSPACASCSVKRRICAVEDGRGPTTCPTRSYGALIREVNKEYKKRNVAAFARAATLQEAQCYAGREQGKVLRPAKTRVQEICEFARKMGYTKLGIAFCSGLMAEARALARIFEAWGFKVVSVICKVGGTPKEALGIAQAEKIHIGEHETMCSPIAQAVILNREKTDFNVLVGLCVGHDYLFFKYARAPSTVLITKDRVLGHNPAAALHTSDSYYSHLQTPEND